MAAGKVAAVLPASGVMAISTDAGTLAGPADADKGTVWDVRTGRALFRFPLRRTGVFPVPTPGLTLSPDGKIVATYYKWEGGNIVTLWDVATQQSRTLLGNPPDSN